MTRHGSACLLLFALPLCAAAPSKRMRLEDPTDTLRLELGCKDNFPSQPKDCPKDLWSRCCKQEVACHDYHCREEVMGKISAGQRVRILADFDSDGEVPASLKKGMKGKVLRVDEEGDASIRFFEDDLDDEGSVHWVYRTTFYEKLELPGKLETSRATRTVNCLNQCSLQQDCRMATMSKKQTKAYNACMQECKMEQCTNEEGCKVLLQQYGACKGKIAEKKVCDAKHLTGEQDEL
mmetsp:Transcript_65342/g.115948  ORF Transcript_65342/g.115948 Transcript_65342/m.115948 type:complete len:236 (-) Transcript_65342:47-754(-)